MTIKPNFPERCLPGNCGNVHCFPSCPAYEEFKQYREDYSKTWTGEYTDLPQFLKRQSD